MCYNIWLDKKYSECWNQQNHELNSCIKVDFHRLCIISTKNVYFLHHNSLQMTDSYVLLRQIVNLATKCLSCSSKCTGLDILVSPNPNLESSGLFFWKRGKQFWALKKAQHIECESITGFGVDLQHNMGGSILTILFVFTIITDIACIIIPTDSDQRRHQKGEAVKVW